MKTCIDLILSLHSVCCFQTTEGTKCGKASNSEIRRWFKAKCIEINGEVNWEPIEELPPLIYRIILFPKNKKKRCTLFYDF